MGMFDFTPGDPTWEAVERRRKLAEALGMQAMGAAPTTFGGGLSAIGAALGGALANRGAERMDARRAELGDAAFEAALGGIPQDNSPLAAALGGAYGAPVSTSVPPVQATALAPSGNPLRDGIVETAQAIGADPLDLATAISYETAGTFDPTKAGPTTQWGQHRGLIQFGEPQAKQYGVDWSDPIGSQLGANGAIANYFRDRGFKPGMSGLDLYSTINAGSPGRYSASDANNGGAPGTVADKWSQQMAPHREKAMSLLGGDYQPAAPSAAAPAMAPMALPAPPPVNVALIRAMNNPHMTPEQKQILGGIYQQQMAMQITPYQQAQLAMAQQQMAWEQQKAMMPEPVKPTDDIREYEFARGQGYQGTFQDFMLEGKRAGATTVNVGGDGAPGLGKLSTDYGYVLDPATMQPVIDPATGLPQSAPVPGSPAAVEAAKVAQAGAVKEGNKSVSTDVITSAAGRAREAAGNRQLGGFGQGVASALPWTDSAEVARQVEVLKSNAKVENLQAMRAASPTGGALGAVSDSENAMLAAKAGALDPSSPTFIRDLDDYERTLLRIVHGPEAGDRIFSQTRANGSQEQSDDDLLRKYGG